MEIANTKMVKLETVSHEKKMKISDKRSQGSQKLVKDRIANGIAQGKTKSSLCRRVLGPLGITNPISTLLPTLPPTIQRRVSRNGMPIVSIGF